MASNLEARIRAIESRLRSAAVEALEVRAARLEQAFQQAATRNVGGTGYTLATYQTTVYGVDHKVMTGTPLACVTTPGALQGVLVSVYNDTADSAHPHASGTTDASGSVAFNDYEPASIAGAVSVTRYRVDGGVRFVAYETAFSGVNAGIVTDTRTLAANTPDYIPTSLAAFPLSRTITFSDPTTGLGVTLAGGSSPVQWSASVFYNFPAAGTCPAKSAVPLTYSLSADYDTCTHGVAQLTCTFPCTSGGCPDPAGAFLGTTTWADVTLTGGTLTTAATVSAKKGAGGSASKLHPTVPDLTLTETFPP